MEYPILNELVDGERARAVFDPSINGIYDCRLAVKV